MADMAICGTCGRKPLGAEPGGLHNSCQAPVSPLGVVVVERPAGVCLSSRLYRFRSLRSLSKLSLWCWASNAASSAPRPWALRATVQSQAT